MQMRVAKIDMEIDHIFDITFPWNKNHRGMRTTVYFHKEHSNVPLYTTSHFLLNGNRMLIPLLLEESNCNQKELQRSPVFSSPTGATTTHNNQPNNYPKSPT
jgi:hypothetical protein